MTSLVDVLDRRTRPIAHEAFLGERLRRAMVVLGVGVSLLLSAGLIVAIILWPRYVPVITLAPLIVVAGFQVPARRLGLLYTPVALVVLVVLPLTSATAVRSVLIDLCVAALMIMMFLIAHARERAGIRGLRGETFVMGLRDELARGGELPPLPAPWRADFKVHAANGEAFSGDFLVTSLVGDQLAVVLVDVSGKGKGAGSRALTLSAALGGILGSVAAQDFLAAANAHLLRLGWTEGFATAIHVEIDLVTGQGSIGRAGHPPAVVHRQGSGAWESLTSRGGPLLGVIDDAHYPRLPLTLTSGDVLLLYSDGVIESRGHDLHEGFDRMLGAANRALLTGGALAQEVCTSALAGNSDDRAVFVLRRG